VKQLGQQDAQDHRPLTVVRVLGNRHQRPARVVPVGVVVVVLNLLLGGADVGGSGCAEG